MGLWVVTLKTRWTTELLPILKMFLLLPTGSLVRPMWRGWAQPLHSSATQEGQGPHTRRGHRKAEGQCSARTGGVRSSLPHLPSTLSLLPHPKPHTGEPGQCKAWRAPRLAMGAAEGRARMAKQDGVQGAQLWGAGSLQGWREFELGLFVGTPAPQVTDGERGRC